MGMPDLPIKPESIHPDIIADRFWELYSKKDKAEMLVGNFGR